MPKKLRHFPSGYIFHVMNRAVVRSGIFSTDQDYDAFVAVLAERQLRVPIRILAWCIMPNHWHLILSPERDQDVSEYMRLVSVTHVQRWHAFHKTSGTPLETTKKRYVLTALARVSQNERHRSVVSRTVQGLCGGRQRISSNGFTVCRTESTSSQPGGTCGPMALVKFASPIGASGHIQCEPAAINFTADCVVGQLGRICLVTSNGKRTGKI